MKLLLRAAWNATRVVLVPAVSLLVAAVLVLLFARAQVDYAMGGHLVDIGSLVGYAVAAYCLLTLAWTAVSALPPAGFVNAVAVWLHTRSRSFSSEPSSAAGCSGFSARLDTALTQSEL